MSHADISKPGAAMSISNILLLNNSTASLLEQVQEARKILELELSDTQSISFSPQNHYNRQGAREEWTLRWLLKKLEGAEVGPQRYSTRCTRDDSG